jgi:hypothetical protein
MNLDTTYNFSVSVQAAASTADFPKPIHKHRQSLQDPKHTVTVTVIMLHGIVIAVVMPHNVVVAVTFVALCVLWSQLSCHTFGVAVAAIMLYSVMVVVTVIVLHSVVVMVIVVAPHLVLWL